MSLSVLLSCTSLYLLFRRSLTQSATSSVPSSTDATTASTSTTDDDLFFSARIGSVYLLAGLSAIWHPGTACLDPESRKVREVDEAAQLWVFGGMLALLWMGWGLERTGKRESKIGENKKRESKRIRQEEG